MRIYSKKIISNRESYWINPYAFKDEMAVKRNNDIDKANLWRPVFVHDIEKIGSIINVEVQQTELTKKIKKVEHI